MTCLAVIYLSRSYKKSNTIYYLGICRVTLLDHHKTAIEEIESHLDHPKNLEVNLDIHLSGATIALQYFKPQVAQFGKESGTKPGVKGLCVVSRVLRTK